MNNPKQLVTQAFRPTHRPPMARLKVFDDGSSEGEIIRLREDTVVIGSEGQVKIPHDPGIASRHLRITRISHEGRYHWELSDLDSDSGFWVRVRSIKLTSGAEFMAGQHQFLFRAGTPKSEIEIDRLKQRLADGSIPGETTLPSGQEPTKPNPGFDQLICKMQNGNQEHSTTVLINGSYWIGRDESCAIALPEDFFLVDHHVELCQDNGWVAKTHGVRNGMWVRRKSIVVTQSCAFQLGEQRFHLSCLQQDDAT